MHIIDLGHLPARDLMFGFSTANVADTLTADNWKTKALLRRHGDSLLYIIVATGIEQWSGNSVYLVRASNLDETASALSARFSNLEEALAYANGEDGGDIAINTVLASPEEYTGAGSGDCNNFHRAAELISSDYLNASSALFANKTEPTLRRTSNHARR